MFKVVKLQLSYLLKTMLQEGSPFDSFEIDSCLQFIILNLSSLAAEQIQDNKSILEDLKKLS